MPMQRVTKGAVQNACQKLILLTGASGYAGGHLLRALEAAGQRIRCTVRVPHAMRTLASRTTVVRADVLDHKSLVAALDGIHSADYLVHSMNSQRSFEQTDREGVVFGASWFSVDDHA
jgi:uncharacterized protein YbjT (DUF2867 family)